MPHTLTVCYIDNIHTENERRKELLVAQLPDPGGDGCFSLSGEKFELPDGRRYIVSCEVQEGHFGFGCSFLKPPELKITRLFGVQCEGAIKSSFRQDSNTELIVELT